MIGFMYVLLLLACDSRAYTPTKPVQKKPKLSKLAQIKHNGVLRVLTRVDPTTYYPVSQGHAGLDYDLITLFAKQLGVKVDYQVVDDVDELLKKIARGEADIAAAGLSITESRKKTIRFASPYHEVVEQVIYRSGTAHPRKPADLNAGILEVVKGSSHVETLRKLKQTSVPNLTWISNPGFDSHKLMGLVDQGLIDYTIADSTQALLIRRFYPKLHIAFDISEPRQIAWGLPLSHDDSLYHEINLFFKQLKKTKTLEQLLERYYGHADTLDYVDKCKFYEHYRSRLPLYRAFFIKAGKEQGIDWRLLAAMGYQESHWEEAAVSPTGVRGIMMLTRDTAQQVGIKDRTDPEQSIKGGAIYFQQQLKKISVTIPEPDHTWFALAAYNIGFGHLDDARVLAKKRSSNPDKWLDVKNILPLLAEEYWFVQTKHGYARGNEPIVYVENVRNYFDLLIWLTAEKPATPKNVLLPRHRPLKERFKRILHKITHSQLIKDLKSLWQQQKTTPAIATQ
jgi:membrane-bound lytic murein transglycosylase F